MAQVQKDSSTWSAINASVWDIVNPINNIGAQFFSGPFSYFTYGRMATKGVANVDPFFLSRFLSFIPKSIYNNAISPSLEQMGWKKGVEGFFSKTGEFLNKFKLPYVKFNKDYGFVINSDFYSDDKLDKIYKKRLKKVGKNKSDKILNRTLKHKTATAIRNNALGKSILGFGIRTLGWIGLVYTTYDIVKTTGEVLNFLHEQSVNLAQEIEAKRQHMLKVDFNKPLYGGYLTAGAYTERQRAIRLLARNPGLPQPFIGNEADRYTRRF